MKNRPEKTVTLTMLRTQRKLVSRLARRRGGVVVLRADGSPAFRLVIPSTRLR